MFIYPVKALKGVEVESLEITENVVKYGKFKDRRGLKLILHHLLSCDILFKLRGLSNKFNETHELC